MVGMPALIIVALSVPMPGTSRSSTRLPGREHRAAGAVFLGGRVHEFELHFGGGERHAVEFEVAGFLHGAVRSSARAR